MIRKFVLPACGLVLSSSLSRMCQPFCVVSPQEPCSFDATGSLQAFSLSLVLAVIPVAMPHAMTHIHSHQSNDIFCSLYLLRIWQLWPTASMAAWSKSDSAA